MEIALSLLLNRIALEVNSHTNCILTERFSILNDLPSVRSDCSDGFLLSERVIWGVNHGCSLFVTSEDCIDSFLGNFLKIHDLTVTKYEKKVLVIVDFKGKLEKEQILSVLRNETVTRWLPYTMILQPSKSNNQEWINIWTATPFNEVDTVRNRYFIENLTLEHENALILDLNDLGGKEIVTALFSYPPFVSIKRVNAGEGNANLYGSNETLSIELLGIEDTLMVEFCRKFNCVISARLEYEEELWGWGYPNHTGTGSLGAVLKYDADLTGGACYLMEDGNNWIQYTTALQRSSVIHVLPKPKPLPYWYTPMLPFSAVIWACALVILTVGITSIYVLSHFQGKLLLNLGTDTEIRDRSLTIIDIFFIVLRMSLFQNSNINYKTLTNTLIYGFFLMYSLVIGNFYLGGLSSIMTITPYEFPIDSIQKLINSKLLWGGSSFTFTLAIKESANPIHQLYVSKFVEASVSELHHLIETEKIAVVMDRTQGGTTSVQGYIDQDDSEFLMVMKEPLSSQYLALVTSKTWPYMEQLNRMAFMQQESGVRDYWEHNTVVQSMDYMVQRNILENMKPPSNSEPVKLSVPHIYGALFLLLFGYLCAAIIFIIEMVYKKHVQGRSIKKVVNLRKPKQLMFRLTSHSH